MLMYITWLLLQFILNNCNKKHWKNFLYYDDLTLISSHIHSMYTVYCFLLRKRKNMCFDSRQNIGWRKRQKKNCGKQKACMENDQVKLFKQFSLKVLGVYSIFSVETTMFSSMYIEGFPLPLKFQRNKERVPNNSTLQNFLKQLGETTQDNDSKKVIKEIVSCL